MHSFHYFNHAAVFKFKMEDSFVTKDSVQQFLKGEYEVTLNPLNEITDDQYTFFNLIPQSFLESLANSLFHGQSKWHRLIGHEPKNEILKSFGTTTRSSITLKQIVTCEFCSRFGMQFSDMALQRPRNNDGDCLPWLAIIDFSKIPVARCDNIALIFWLKHRNIETTAKIREELVNLVNRVIEGNSHKPNKLLLDEHGEEYPAEYASFDNIMPSETMIWHQFDDKLLSIIRDEVITIDSIYMEKIFGNNTPGTAHRGYSRVQGGSYMKDTMRYSTVKGEYIGIKKDFVFMQVKCTPSMKSDEWGVHCVFERTDGAEKYKYLKAPNSRCLCPDGLLFCSHMYGFFIILGVMQQDNHDMQWLLDNVIRTNIRENVSMLMTQNMLEHVIETTNHVPKVKKGN